MRVARRPLVPGAVLPRAAGLAPGWEVLEEAAPDPRRSPDLRRWGVRALRVRHYTSHASPGGARVCSVEVWAFHEPGRAGAARLVFRRAGWRVERAGPLLVLAHGVTLTLGELPRRGPFPACMALVERSHTRARRLVAERRRSVAAATAAHGAR